VFLVVIFLRGAYNLSSPLVMSPDSRTYSRWADQLIAVNFNYADYLQNVSFVIPPVFYAGWITLVAGAKVICGSHWQQALIVVNVLANAMLAVLVVDMAGRITRQPKAAWLAFLLFCITYEIFIWTRYVLSDSTFLLLNFAIFSVLSRLLLANGTGCEEDGARPQQSSSRILIIALAVLCPLAFIWRPTSVVLLPLIVVAAFLLWRLRQAPPSQPVQQRARNAWRKRALGAGVVFLCITGLWIGHAALMQQPERWPTRALSATIKSNSKDYAGGIVVWDRPDTFHAPPTSLQDYVAISADRFKHFFHPIPNRPTFSLRHRIFSLCLYLSIYPLACISLGALLMAKTGLGRREEAVAALAVGYVFAFAVFHSITQLDYAWRYRAPILPHLILLASIGFAMLFNRRTRTEIG